MRLTCDNPHWQSIRCSSIQISDVMLNNQIKVEAMKREELIIYIVISTDKTMCRQMYQLQNEWQARCPS